VCECVCEFVCVSVSVCVSVCEGEGAVAQPDELYRTRISTIRVGFSVVLVLRAH
jgi:hypothetical protein